MVLENTSNSFHLKDGQGVDLTAC